MEFSRQKYWSGSPVPSPGDLPDPRIKPRSPELQEDFFFYCLSHQAIHGSNSIQFSSVTQSCPTFRNPMNHSTPSLPVHHQLLEFTQAHVHRGCMCWSWRSLCHYFVGFPGDTSLTMQQTLSNVGSIPGSGRSPE